MHEKKSCPRCGQMFECKAGDITQCACFEVALPVDLKAWLEQYYNDCLCVGCLQQVSKEFELFEEMKPFAGP